MAIVLPEYASTFNLIAACLRFSIRHVACIRSLTNRQNSVPISQLDNPSLRAPGALESKNNMWQYLIKEAQDSFCRKANETPGKLVTQNLAEQRLMTPPVTPKPTTLFEKIIQLSSELAILNKYTRKESIKNPTEHRYLQSGAETRSTLRSATYSDVEKAHYPREATGKGGAK